MIEALIKSHIGKLAGIINSIQKGGDGTVSYFPRMVHEDDINLDGFERVGSSIDGIDFEYIKPPRVGDNVGKRAISLYGWYIVIQFEYTD